MQTVINVKNRLIIGVSERCHLVLFRKGQGYGFMKYFYYAFCSEQGYGFMYYFYYTFCSGQGYGFMEYFYYTF
jgi:hypothetical protein